MGKRSRVGCATSAFSLIEFILVIALVAFLALLAISNMGFLQRRIVKAHAEQLLSTMMYMQREAMVANAKKNLTFSPSRNQYSYNQNVVTLPQGVRFGVIAGVQGPPSLHSKQPQGAVTYQNQEIVFLPDGKMSAGSVYLTDSNYQVMYAITTAVSHISYIRMYVYYRGKWERIR
ncbi:MAG: GspH/FimT family pseudopilin [Candidatus Babeliales bacterium]